LCTASSSFSWSTKINQTALIFIVSWVHWKDNANSLDVLPIEGVLADGVVHATHMMAEPSQAVPLYPLPNSGLFLAAMEDHIIV